VCAVRRNEAPSRANHDATPEDAEDSSMFIRPPSTKFLSPPRALSRHQTDGALAEANEAEGRCLSTHHAHHMCAACHFSRETVPPLFAHARYFFRHYVTPHVVQLLACDMHRVISLPNRRVAQFIRAASRPRRPAFTRRARRQTIREQQFIRLREN